MRIVATAFVKDARKNVGDFVRRDEYEDVEIVHSRVDAARRRKCGSRKKVAYGDFLAYLQAEARREGKNIHDTATDNRGRTATTRSLPTNFQLISYREFLGLSRVYAKMILSDGKRPIFPVVRDRARQLGGTILEDTVAGIAIPVWADQDQDAQDTWVYPRTPMRMRLAVMSMYLGEMVRPIHVFDTLVLRDLNDDGRTEYLFVHNDGSVDAWLNLGGPDDGPDAAKVSWFLSGLIATGIDRDGAGVQFADLNGDGQT
ncbi:hypothetical protein C8R44DRAFT_924558 [Mycena epipterygia]|nr:hypothetical protein C8R44DRAFT_924558 [Mycena epipterygia]